MSLQTVVFFCFLCLLSSVCSKSNDRHALYDEFINKVVNFKELKQKLEASFPDIDDGTLTVLKMLDASTKIPNGILAGNVFDLGNFDECYNIEYQDIYGKYCLGTLQISLSTQKYFEAFQLNGTQRRTAAFIHPQPRLVGLGPEFTGLHFAACVPSNWSASDIPGLLQYSEDLCYSKATEPKFSTGAIITTVVLSIVLAIIVFCTAFDIYLYYSKKELPHELLIAFSFLSNGRKLFKSTTNSDQLLCLNGIKAISMMWVIIGHEFSLLENAAVTNFSDLIDKFQQDPANMYLMAATLSVDTFFVVGGLVTVYVFLKSVDKGVRFNIILYYIHRYLRLTPALAIMALIHLYLVNYFGNGPLWKVVDWTLVKPCEDGWWSTFLYITNYVQDGYCLPQGWYLSVDMQLFILSPIILIPLTKWPKITLGALGALSIAGCIVPFAISYVKHIGTMLDPDSENYLNNYYYQTYARFGPYVMGMMLGYYLYKIKKSELRIRWPLKAVWAFWFLCLASLTACVYAGHPLYIAEEEDRWGNALYVAFDKQAWSLALCGVIFLCVSGYGGPVDYFLSLPIFQFLAKVSYSMYLIHYTVITVRYAGVKNVIKFSTIGEMHIFWSDFMFTLFLSLILCLSFESPIIILEKYLFGRGLSKPTRKKVPEV